MLDDYGTRNGSSHIEPRRIVIAGGGVGAIEALLALRDLGEATFDITVVAPDEQFVLRALTVAEPFAAGHSDLGAFDAIVREQGSTLHRATLTEVDPAEHTVLCSDGERLPYDVLVLSPGARPRAAFPTGITFGLGDPAALNGLLADLEQGYTDTVAFVVPSGVTWALPLYELALMTAGQVRGMGRDVTISLVTPEPAPLAIFGPEASAAVAGLLAEAGIAVHCGIPPVVGRHRVHLVGGEDIVVERVVSLPLLEGPRLPGVPADSAGFIPTDTFGRVPGLDGVYAVGDASDMPVKQGGLACQQADVVAAHIAREAGADVASEPLAPVLRGKLMTGRVSRFLRRDLHEASGREDVEPLWWPPAKVVGRYLAPWLAHRGRGPQPQPEAAAREPAADEAVEVEVPLDAMARLRPDVLGLDPLGRMRT
jgi:sulfide:quinone oxidoreductase